MKPKRRTFDDIQREARAEGYAAGVRAGRQQVLMEVQEFCHQGLCGLLATEQRWEEGELIKRLETT